MPKTKMINPQNVDLLCSLAEQYDWEMAKNTLRGILEEAKPTDVANLAIEYVRLYLPRFNHLYPHETWPGECLNQIREFMFSDETNEDHLGLFPETDRKYDSAITRTFREAVSSLWSMARWKNNRTKFSEYATDTISIMITVLRAELDAWFPKELESVLRNGIDSREAGKILWLDLAGRLKGLSKAS